MASAQRQVVGVPVAAAALMHCLRSQLTSKDYWVEQTAALQAAPGLLRLLLLLAHAQPRLTSQVGWMDGWMYYTGLARQSTDRKALYEEGIRQEKGGLPS
jgi:hypothetical protein